MGDAMTGDPLPAAGCTEDGCRFCHPAAVFRAGLLAEIDREGWVISGVVDPPEHAFAYTVGLTAQGLHELMMVGDPHEVRELLNAYALEHASSDTPPLEAGTERSIPVDGEQVRVSVHERPAITLARDAVSIYGRFRLLEIERCPQQEEAVPG